MRPCRFTLLSQILHLQEMTCSFHTGDLLKEHSVVLIKQNLIFYHICPVHFQIFLRVAEETGVDAESELQAESPLNQQPSAGQRAESQHTEEPETGMH